MNPVSAVVIGRNEGERLRRCLTAISGSVEDLVYVDSGSTDESLAIAEKFSASIAILDISRPFTAARARNAGVARLVAEGSTSEFVQFVDGDCELQPGWIEAAKRFLEETPKAAVVAGRLRERFPESSVYNRLCDAEWNTPVGSCGSVGGIFMIRAEAFDAVGGFDPALIAGEEPELCVRLRAAGWEVWRIDAEMTLHDAAMTRFSQWWQRARRGGYAAAEGAAMHGRAPERHGVARMRRALFWGLGLPIASVLGAVFSPWALLLLLAWPLQVGRLALRAGATHRAAWEQAFFLTLGKLPEAQGVLEYHWRRLTGRRRGLIEYKGNTPASRN